MLTVVQSSKLNLKSELGITSKSLEGSMLTQNMLAKLWGELFTGNRGQTCKAELARAKALRALLAAGLVPGQPGGTKSKNSKDSWVKRWGYGAGSYLFDFFDPLFQDEFVGTAKKIYRELMKISNLDTEFYQDRLDVKKLIGQNNYKSINYKELNKNYDPAQYEISVNTVQLNTAMKEWNWYVGPGEKDYAFNFVTKYDFNGDGRLNPRELILGIIDLNKNVIGVAPCKNCFQEIGRKLDAIFIFLDCNNDGILSAEDLWNKLTLINRPDDKYNIFGIRNSDSIRTNAINDFVIKNGIASDGMLSKDEFRSGILYGLWDRQTRENSIVIDDSRNLKYLRWTEGGMTDTAAFNYLTEQVLAELIAKSQSEKKN
jgi:hypothetical protein